MLLDKPFLLVSIRQYSCMSTNLGWIHKEADDEQ